MELEHVDPISVVDEAVLVLRDAWPLPVLHYTADYLKWQLGFPGPPAQGILAREAGEPAGFIAIFPRRFRFRGVVADGYVYSFVAVRPAFRGRGLASKLYEEMMLVFRASGLPGVVFVEPHSAAAQRPLFKAGERLGVKVKRLGQYQNYGFMLRASAPAPSAVAVEAEHLDEVLAVVEGCESQGTLWAAPDRARLEHYLRDPRPRKLLVVREGERCVGAAMAFLSEIATAGGLDRVATLDTVFLPEPTADWVAALARATAQVFAGRTTAPAVSAPSLATIPAEVFKPAGLRRSGTVFDGFVLHGDDHPFLEAEVTNLEVI